MRWPQANQTLLFFCLCAHAPPSPEDTKKCDRRSCRSESTALIKDNSHVSCARVCVCHCARAVLSPPPPYLVIVFAFVCLFVDYEGIGSRCTTGMSVPLPSRFRSAWR